MGRILKYICELGGSYICILHAPRPTLGHVVPTQALRHKIIFGVIDLPQPSAEADCMFVPCNMRRMSAKWTVGFHTMVYLVMTPRPLMANFRLDIYAGSRGRASVVIHIHIVTEIVEVGRCRGILMPRMHCLCTRILSKFQLVKRWNKCQDA